MILPWEKIDRADAGDLFRYQLADIDHPFEFYWARDGAGAFAFRFKGRFEFERIERDAPAVAGIRISGSRFGGFCYLDLVLERSENAELFYALCRSLMQATAKLDSDRDEAALDSILTHIRRWQDLLRAAAGEGLSIEAQLGLFGELLALRDILFPNMTPLDAVSCWTGPHPDEQDFGYGTGLLEVKSARSTRDREFSVSSLEQLDTSSGTVTLLFQTFGIFEDDPPNGMSLNQMVDSITALLAGDALADTEFKVKLQLSGYVRHARYDRTHFLPASRRFFAVEGDFPRIEPAGTRAGITKVRYSVELDACIPFEITDAQALARFMSGQGGKIQAFRVPPEQLVKLPESSELEFKSSLRWSVRDQRVEPALEDVVVKTVAALANTRGGQLVLGVDDSNTVLGLQPDYDSLGKKKDRDGFELHLMQLLRNAFGTAFAAHNLRTEFAQVDGGEICIINILAVKTIVAVEKAGRSIFYVRVGNGTKELSGAEIIAYNDVRSRSS